MKASFIKDPFMRYLAYVNTGCAILGAVAVVGITSPRNRIDSINNEPVNSTYQDLPKELRDYDKNPRDGYLNANELEHLLRDFELKKR